MASPVSLQSAPTFLSPINHSPIAIPSLQIALATIFFSSLIQTAEGNPSTFMACIQNCMQETTFFAKSLGCAALCSPLLLMK